MQNAGEDKASPMRAKVMFAVSGYMFCSASMLLVNKLAVHFLPAPSFVLLSQFVIAALAVRRLSHMDPCRGIP
jgi:GDP-mannose transporter